MWNLPYRCWVTFLGPHGHCEAGAKEFPLYNSDDTPDGYEKHGSSTSKSRNERTLNPTLSRLVIKERNVEIRRLSNLAQKVL